jgi:hypothetical protein
MAHMTLPPEHSQADARLAERIGWTLHLEEVHVFWTLPGTDGTAAPAAASGAAGGEQNAPLGVAGAFAALGALLGRISGHLARH